MEATFRRRARLERHRVSHRTRRLAVAALTVLVLVACSAKQTVSTLPAQATVHGAPGVPADPTRLGLQPSPPQQPSDPPLLTATQPDLPPRDGPLVATPLQTPGETAAKFSAPHTLNLPRGFQVSLYAVTGGGPRFLALSPDGQLYATLIGRGQVVRLVEQSDVRVARPQVVLDGLNTPHGIAFTGGYLYVGETNQIVRFPYHDGQVDQGGKQVVVPNLPTGGHATRTVGFGPDGQLYVAIGSSCNVCIEQNPLRAAITVYDPAGGGGQTYAAGLRNAVGFVFQPGSGDLWATVNGRDNIGQDMGLTGDAATQATDNLPPDYVTHVAAGGNYGWPRCYGDHQLDPRFGDAAFCATTLAASVQLQAHSAPLGLGVYSGSSFPADYQGDLFVALHGSWNRSVKTGYKVIRVKFQAGQPVAVEDFMTGWLGETGAWGRPVDVLTGPDGALYITDDSAGVVYRVTYGGG